MSFEEEVEKENKSEDEEDQGEEDLSKIFQKFRREGSRRRRRGILLFFPFWEFGRRREEKWGEEDLEEIQASYERIEEEEVQKTQESSESEDPSENESLNEEEEENQEVDPLPLLEQQEWNVEELLERKTFQGRIYYKVKWVGFEDTTWEPFKNLTGCKLLLAAFHENEKVPMSSMRFKNFPSSAIL